MNSPARAASPVKVISSFLPTSTFARSPSRLSHDCGRPAAPAATPNAPNQPRRHVPTRLSFDSTALRAQAPQQELLQHQESNASTLDLATSAPTTTTTTSFALPPASAPKRIEAVPLDVRQSEQYKALGTSPPKFNVPLDSRTVNIRPRLTIRAMDRVRSHEEDFEVAHGLSVSSTEVQEPRRRPGHRAPEQPDLEHALPARGRSRASSPSAPSSRSLSRPAPAQTWSEALASGLQRARDALSALVGSDSEGEDRGRGAPAPVNAFRPATRTRRSKSPGSRRPPVPQPPSSSTAAAATGSKIGYDASGALYLQPRTREAGFPLALPKIALPTARQVLVGTVICASTFFLAEIIRQVFLNHYSVLALNWGRIVTLTAFGLLFKGPSLVYFYKALDSVFPGKTARALAPKLLIDLGPWAWLQNGLFLWYVAASEGLPWALALSLAIKQLIPLQMSAYQVWLPAHLLNHSFILPKFKVFYVNLVGLCWTVFLCVKANVVA